MNLPINIEAKKLAIAICREHKWHRLFELTLKLKTAEP
jgi:hypothetical protein